MHFDVRGERLYGMLHIPDAVSSAPCVVFCHGFTGHRIEAHRLFVKAARALVAHGIAALRFDFRGSGESDGDFADMTVSREIEDAHAAIEFAASQPEVNPLRLGLLGLSLGGCVAACCAPVDERIRALVLWAAVARPNEIIRRNLDAEQLELLDRRGWLIVNGMRVGKQFFDDIERIEPLNAVRQFRNAALVVHGSLDQVVPVEDAHLYADALGGETQLRIIEGADHTFSRYDWESEVIRITCEWLSSHL